MSRRPVVALGTLAVALPGLLLGAGVAPGKGKGSSGQRKALFATMTGRSEVGANGKKGAGDPDGFGSFSAIAAGSKLCFGMTVRGLDQPVAAHIHRGNPSVSGPIVVPLTQPTSGDAGASSGCVTVSDAKLLSAIVKHPSRYYVNVHTQAFPSGAVRGQLGKND
jgi:CHRD domain